MSNPTTGRLSKAYEYRRIYKEGRLAKGDFLWVYLLLADSTAAKVGVIVGRSIEKRSTARNRLKRIIREWFRSQKNLCLDNCAVVVKVVKKPPSSKKTISQTIRQQLLHLLSKLTVTKNEF